MYLTNNFRGLRIVYIFRTINFHQILIIILYKIEILVKLTNYKRFLIIWGIFFVSILYFFNWFQRVYRIIVILFTNKGIRFHLIIIIIFIIIINDVNVIIIRYFKVQLLIPIIRYWLIIINIIIFTIFLCNYYYLYNFPG